MKHINEIKLEGDSKFIEQFNDCSDYWQKAHDQNLTEEERKEALEIWFVKRQCLELGIN
jgi:hypothetical protein